MRWVRALDQDGPIVVGNLNLVTSYTESVDKALPISSGGGTQLVTAMFEDEHSTPMKAAAYHDACGGGSPEPLSITIV